LRPSIGPRSDSFEREKPLNMEPVRIHLADDHTMFREGLEALLSSRKDVEVVGSSSTSKEAAARIARTKSDLVITELDTQTKTAQEILEGIRSASPESKIVVLTLFDNLHYLKALSRMGIDAYLHKTSTTEELMATIDALGRRASSGGESAVVWMPRGLIERLEAEPAGALSERETEILVLAARGLANYRIACELVLAPSTVKRHLANIYQKIGVRSRSEAVRRALQEQWIGLGEITEAADTDGSEGG
jgi:DNA-binding NarL/FixJ family response regulator